MGVISAVTLTAQFLDELYADGILPLNPVINGRVRGFGKKSINQRATHIISKALSTVLRHQHDSDVGMWQADVFILAVTHVLLVLGRENGKGNAGKRNGVPGDLLILVEEEPHAELIRDENDLIYNLLLDVPTAALGGTADIPTIDSKVRVKIEPGTQPGKVLRLRGKGLPNVNGYGTGDLLVNISVYIPETLNREEKAAMEKFQKSDNFRPNESLKEKIFRKFKNFFD